MVQQLAPHSHCGTRALAFLPSTPLAQAEFRFISANPRAHHPPAFPCPTGSGPYSTVRWNPFGRFLVLAGIGNLPGDLAFYDKKADGKCKPMGQTRCANASHSMVVCRTLHATHCLPAKSNTKSICTPADLSLPLV